MKEDKLRDIIREEITLAFQDMESASDMGYDYSNRDRLIYSRINFVACRVLQDLEHRSTRKEPEHDPHDPFAPKKIPDVWQEEINKAISDAIADGMEVLFQNGKVAVRLYDYSSPDQRPTRKELEDAERVYASHGVPDDVEDKAFDIIARAAKYGVREY